MQTQKINLKNIKDVLSRDEMRAIMAGSHETGACTITCKDASGNKLGTIETSSCGTEQSQIDKCVNHGHSQTFGTTCSCLA